MASEHSQVARTINQLFGKMCDQLVLILDWDVGILGGKFKLEHHGTLFSCFDFNVKHRIKVICYDSQILNGCRVI